jgi:uncharacterized protein YbcV (DUF1398 family)
MFTLNEIKALHDRFGRAETLAEYVRGLRAIGVERFDSYLTDGHSEYFGGGHSVVSAPAHERLSVADTSSRDELLKHLGLHEQGKTTYLEMSSALAENGVEKWTMDTGRLTMTYVDKAGDALLVEHIE